MADQYKYGREKEQKVARLLRSKGASVEVSKGSRSAVDMKVAFPTGTKWNVQVKSTRRGMPSPPSTRDIGRLKQVSTKARATPVIAEVSPKGVYYKSARSGRKLTPPNKKR